MSTNPSLKAKVKDLASRWRPRRVLVEDASSGTALAQELRGAIPGIIAIKPDRDKVSRMAIASATEQEIQQSLAGLAVGRTTLIIAHRLATIAHAERTILVENGDVTEIRQGSSAPWRHEAGESRGRTVRS